MIKDKIKSDSVIALKNHDSGRVSVLRFLVSLIDKKELQLPPNSMKEEDQIGVLRKELKNKEEAKALFVQAGRSELVAEVENEIAIVKEYLPAEIDVSEVEKAVVEVIEANSGANFGMVMGMVMKKMAGKASGDVVSRIVKEKMNG
jgi:uncharacterized protein YqeY